MFRTSDEFRRWMEREHARADARPRAWAFFSAQPPWYRRTATWWVVSARQEATRARRLAMLIEHSGRGRRVPPFAPEPPDG